jgi:hypothetical protein
VDPVDYPGLEVEVWLNPPHRLLVALTSKEAAASEAEAALRQVVLAHNGWMDGGGAPLPPPSEMAFWEAIPTELAALTVGAYLRTFNDLPNFLSAKLGGSASGSAPATGGD